MADILIFDPDTLGTTASFYTPRISPSGIETVLINGQVILQDGEFKDHTKAGQVIRANYGR